MRIMPGAMRNRPFRAEALALCALIVAACSASPTPGTVPGEGSPSATVLATTPTASPTPEPLAALVHGVGISLASFEREVDRFEASQAELGIELATLGDYRSQVLDALIDRLLLAIGAEGRGFSLSEDEVNERLASIAEELGGEEAMGAWLASNDYTLEEFKTDLALDMKAAYMVSAIADELPETVEHVRARHLLVATRQEAEELSQRIQAGEEFADLASVYSLDSQSRLAGGDLGWFIRGQLTTPEIEDAAFALEIGELSGVIQTQLGYHLVLPIEREQRPVYGEARTRYREAAIEAWLDEIRQTAEIEIYITP